MFSWKKGVRKPEPEPEPEADVERGDGDGYEDDAGYEGEDGGAQGDEYGQEQYDDGYEADERGGGSADRDGYGDDGREPEHDNGDEQWDQAPAVRKGRSAAQQQQQRGDGGQDAAASAGVDGASGEIDPFDPDVEQDVMARSIEGTRRFVRMVSIAAAAFLTVLGVYLIASVDFAAGYVLSVWVILLSPVQILAELKRKMVLVNFHLLRYRSGRGLYFILLASLAAGIATTEAWAGAIAGFVAAGMMIGFSCCHRRYRPDAGEHNELVENFERMIEDEEAREAEEALAENPDGKEMCTRDFARRLLRWFCAFVASVLFSMGLYMFYTTTQPGFTLGLTCLAMQSPNSQNASSFKSCTVTAVIIGFWLVLTGPVLLLVEFRSRYAIKYFQFMRFRPGRAAVYLVVGSLSFSVSTSEGYVVGALSLLTGLINLSYMGVAWRQRAAERAIEDKRAAELRAAQKKEDRDRLRMEQEQAKTQFGRISLPRVGGARAAAPVAAPAPTVEDDEPIVIVAGRRTGASFEREPPQATRSASQGSVRGGAATRPLPSAASRDSVRSGGGGGGGDGMGSPGGPSPAGRGGAGAGAGAGARGGGRGGGLSRFMSRGGKR